MILTLKKVVFMFGYCSKILVLIFLMFSFFIKPLAANDVQIAQELLTKLGYTPGPIDGSYGSKTKFALENFYAAQNKKFDGQLSANEIMSLSKASKNPNFSFEALKMMDDHIEKSELLMVPLPKSNLVIKDYQRFRDYRVQHYVNNYSNWENLWERKGSSGQILNKKYCYDTLANFLIPTSPNIKFKGRSHSDFTRCQHAFLTFGVLNFNASFEMYQKLFLEMATSEKDHWVYRRSTGEDNNPTFYHLGGVIATFYMYYAVNYEAFDYTKKQRNIIENYFKKKAFHERFNLDGDRRTSLCPITSPMSLNKRVHMPNNCGSVRLRFAAGELALAIVTQDEALWKKGLWDLDYALSMTNDEGFFVPLSAKGCRALGYTWDTSRLFSLNVEMLKLAGYNLLDYKTRHGKTVSQAYEMLFKQYDDITISNHIAIKGIGASSCGEKPYKTHNEFLIEEFGSIDFGGQPRTGRFINWSIRFVSEKHPEWIDENTLREIETDPFIGNYHTVTAFEIYNANVMSEPNSIWKEKRVKLNLEEKLNEEKRLLKAKEEERKKQEFINSGDYIFDNKNKSFQLSRHDEIFKIHKSDFSLSIKRDDEKLFNGDIAYSTNRNNFGATWIDLKVMGTNEKSLNIKIAFQIEEGSFPNFAEAFSISKNVCGVFKGMSDDSFIIPLKTDNLNELVLFDCQIKVLQENLNMNDFDIIRDRIKTAISLLENLDLPEVHLIKEERKKQEFIQSMNYAFDEKNKSFQLKRHNEIIKINKNDFSLNFDSIDEKFFDGDISYTTNTNNFGTTWIGLKVKKTDEVSHNIKIAFQIEEGSFPNFPEAFSTSKNECGVFEDMVDDSFIIPLKTDDLFELELFDCHVKVLQENLNDDDFGILQNRINTAISLVDTIEITNKYF